ncbi:MAG: D-aminoacyl-tRNA deacylase [Christensenellales bacterium]|jgi:D-tyrosyl-tRNA(Tyr) deacylase
MRAVVQRVRWAKVEVSGEVTGAIEHGLMVLVGAEKGDAKEDMLYCADKVRGLRIFEDDESKMNLSVADVGGKILLVSQFTLLGDARRGRRPSFSDAEEPEKAEALCDAMKEYLLSQGVEVETGRFRAHMEVSLLNDGPVTILLDSRRRF